MKPKIIIYIILAFLLQTFLASFPIPENGCQALESANQVNKNFLLSTYTTTAVKIMMELVTKTNSAPLPVEHKSKKDTNSTDNTLPVSQLCSFSATSTQSLRQSSNSAIATDISNMLYFWDMARHPLKIPNAFVFLSFLVLIYMLPRGSIDPSFIFAFNKVG
ncbi:MAG: hypothetical protein LHV68_12395 [Elusimicrobia bacterium]|nr:hypothetical protein [Candidatus Liberimonas magnetica]